MKAFPVGMGKAGSFWDWDLYGSSGDGEDDGNMIAVGEWTLGGVSVVMCSVVCEYNVWCRSSVMCVIGVKVRSYVTNCSSGHQVV